MRSTSATLRSATLLQGRQQVEDRVIRQPVEHELAVAPGRDQSGAPQVLEMLRGVGDREPGALGQRFDAALALGDHAPAARGDARARCALATAANCA